MQRFNFFIGTVIPTSHIACIERTTCIHSPGENLSFLRTFQTFELAARMLIRTFESPACIFNLLLLLLKNGCVRSLFNIRTKLFVIKVDRLFLIRLVNDFHAVRIQIHAGLLWSCFYSFHRFLFYFYLYCYILLLLSEFGDWIETKVKCLWWSWR